MATRAKSGKVPYAKAVPVRNKKEKVTKAMHGCPSEFKRLSGFTKLEFFKYVKRFNVNSDVKMKNTSFSNQEVLFMFLEYLRRGYGYIDLASKFELSYKQATILAHHMIEILFPNTNDLLMWPNVIQWIALYCRLRINNRMHSSSQGVVATFDIMPIYTSKIAGNFSKKNKRQYCYKVAILSTDNFIIAMDIHPGSRSDDECSKMGSLGEFFKNPEAFNFPLTVRNLQHDKAGYTFGLGEGTHRLIVITDHDVASRGILQQVDNGQNPMRMTAEHLHGILKQWGAIDGPARRNRRLPVTFLVYIVAGIHQFKRRFGECLTECSLLCEHTQLTTMFENMV